MNIEKTTAVLLLLSMAITVASIIAPVIITDTGNGAVFFIASVCLGLICVIITLKKTPVQKEKYNGDNNRLYSLLYLISSFLFLLTALLLQLMRVLNEVNPVWCIPMMIAVGIVDCMIGHRTNDEQSSPLL